MKIEHLREFATLAVEGNFTGAARKLYITQPALSKHVAALEEELGLTLLERNTHSTSLTPAGTVAYELFSRVLADYDRAMEALAVLKAGYARELRLGFLLHGLDENLYRGATSLAALKPQWRVTTEFHDARDLVAGLLDGTLDACLLLEPGVPESPFVRYRKIKAVPLFALVLEEDPLADRDSLGLEDLTERTLVLPRDEEGYVRSVAALFDSRGLARPPMAYTPQKGTQRFTMAECQGVAIISGLSPERGQSGFRAIPFDDPTIAVNFGWVYRVPENGAETQELEVFLTAATAALHASGAV